MSFSTVSPNMGLIIPTPGQEPGPDWADDINNDFLVLDQHSHAPGSGVPITPDGLNINSDLAFQSTNAYQLRSVRFDSQSAPIAEASDVSCAYFSGGNFYINNSSGTAVQITNGSSVNAGAGSITGLPSGTASVTFSASKYVFQSATSTPATIDVGSVIVRNPSASGKGVTLAAPAALGADYGLTLPAVPGATNFLSIDSSGNIAPYAAIAGGLTGSNLANQTVAQVNLAVRSTGTSVGAGGVAIAAASGSYSNATPIYTLVTNQTITITTTGRPVYITLQGDGTAGNSWIGGTTSCGFNLRRGASLLNSYIVSATGSPVSVPPGSFAYLDVVVAGTYTYTLYAASTGGTVQAEAIKMVAYEI